MSLPVVATVERWRMVCTRLGINEDERIYRQLIRAWNARSRHYHSLAHLEACLREFDSVRANAQRAGEVEVALWFHDAVYKTYSKHNEEHSAAWATKFLRAQGANDEEVARTHTYILATRHGAEALTGDAALVVDIDLAILGQSREVYDEFERNVRKEYWWVSKRRYVKGRTAVLQSFLDRPRIYAVDLLRDKYESAARSNIQHAIARLAAL